MCKTAAERRLLFYVVLWIDWWYWCRKSAFYDWKSCIVVWMEMSLKFEQSKHYACQVNVLLLLLLQERWWSIVVRARVFVSLCVCPRTTRAIFTKFLVHWCILPMAVARSSSGRLKKSKGAILGLFFPIDNALYIWDPSKNDWTDQYFVWDDGSAGP